MRTASRGATPKPRRSLGALAALLVAGALGLAGCGGDQADEQLSPGGALAARLPAGDALNVAVVDVNAIRASLGLDPGSGPPTGSDSDDLAFFRETDPALTLTRTEMPPAVVTALLAQAQAIATVSGDRGATAISTSGSSAALEGLLRSSGLKQEGATFVTADGTLAIAVSDGLVGIATNAGDARSIAEGSPGGVPTPLDQVDGGGELVTLARFGARCLESVATSDSVGKPGEVAFFTAATPDPARVRSTLEPGASPRIDGDSIRIDVPAASDARGEPPALRALSSRSVSYDCDG